jgi:transcriptional regulator with XRE-family HTH domain
MMNLSQMSLADELDRSSQAIQKYESGENRVAASMLWRIARAVGVSVEYFFAELQTEHKPDPRAQEEEAIALRVVKPLMALSAPVRELLICFIRGLGRVPERG